MCSNNKKITYQSSGVDVAAGQRAVSLMKASVASTYTPQVLGDLGSFGGLFRLTGEYKDPVLVSGTDGVGTKLRIAMDLNVHNTVGQDLVAMSVNDILCQGARPLFFLDYIGIDRMNPEKVASVVEGIAEGCKKAKVALIGGETAEMGDFYKQDEYDLVGFAVGVAEKNHLITGENIQVGDHLLGLASSGLHSNGYTLVRHLIDKNEYDLFDSSLGKTIGEALLTPTKIYSSAMTALFDSSLRSSVHGVVHVTGGGFYENIPRPIPSGLCAKVSVDRWQIPSIFNILQQRGVAEKEMFATFNMGIGMVLMVEAEQAEAVKNILSEYGETVYDIGEIIADEQQKIKVVGEQNEA